MLSARSEKKSPLRNFWRNSDHERSLRSDPDDHITREGRFGSVATSSSGYSNFIVGTTTGTRWWSTGGLTTDTWSGSTATSTNGKDPCVALGAGWRLPSAADWQNLKNYEDLEGSMAAFMSNLKLPAGGFRDAYGGFVFKGSETYYWTSTAQNAYATGLFISDNTYAAVLQASDRGQGFSCRCVKD